MKIDTQPRIRFTILVFKWNMVDTASNILIDSLHLGSIRVKRTEDFSCIWLYVIAEFFLFWFSLYYFFFFSGKFHKHKFVTNSSFKIQVQDNTNIVLTMRTIHELASKTFFIHDYHDSWHILFGR